MLQDILHIIKIKEMLEKKISQNSYEFYVTKK